MRQYSCSFSSSIPIGHDTLIQKQFEAEVRLLMGVASVTEIRTVSVVGGVAYIIDKHSRNRAYPITPVTNIKYFKKVSE